MVFTIALAFSLGECDLLVSNCASDCLRLSVDSRQKSVRELNDRPTHGLLKDWICSITEAMLIERLRMWCDTLPLHLITLTIAGVTEGLQGDRWLMYRINIELRLFTEGLFCATFRSQGHALKGGVIDRWKNQVRSKFASSKALTLYFWVLQHPSKNTLPIKPL